MSLAFHLFQSSEVASGVFVPVTSRTFVSVIVALGEMLLSCVLERAGVRRR